MEEFEVAKVIEGDGVKVDILITPFAEVKLRITFFKEGRLVDELRSRGALDPQAISNTQWFIEKYAPRGANWYPRLLEWWNNKGWPRVSREIIQRNKPVPNPNINLRATHRDS